MKRILTGFIKNFNIGDEVKGAVCFEALQWRDRRPVWDKDRCFKCGICYVSCPDAAIVLMEDGFYGVDDSRCKGCGVCAQSCINEVIVMKPEEK